MRIVQVYWYKNIFGVFDKLMDQFLFLENITNYNVGTFTDTGEFFPGEYHLKFITF